MHFHRQSMLVEQAWAQIKDNAMSSAKSSSGVHFYGRMYIGYDDKQTGSAADVENLDDGGSKSRLGLKFTES